MHASTMFHTASICVFLNSLFPAMDKMVWYAASTFQSQIKFIAIRNVRQYKEMQRKQSATSL